MSISTDNGIALLVYALVAALPFTSLVVGLLSISLYKMKIIYRSGTPNGHALNLT